MGAYKQEIPARGPGQAIEAESKYPLGYDIHAAQEGLDEIKAFELVIRGLMQELRKSPTLSGNDHALLGEMSKHLIALRYRALDAIQHLAYAVRDADQIRGR